MNWPFSHRRVACRTLAGVATGAAVCALSPFQRTKKKGNSLGALLTERFDRLLSCVFKVQSQVPWARNSPVMGRELPIGAVHSHRASFSSSMAAKRLTRESSFDIGAKTPKHWLPDNEISMLRCGA
jgi:hypothetical protein